MKTTDPTLFRLRIDAKVVGYMKLYSSGLKEFSNDQFWWHGQVIEYDQKDQFSGQLDKNNRTLFEHDIILMRTASASAPKINCLVEFNEKRQTFMLVELDTNTEYELFANDLAIFHKSELTFVGFSFPEASDIYDI